MRSYGAQDFVDRVGSIELHPLEANDKSFTWKQLKCVVGPRWQQATKIKGKNAPKNQFLHAPGSSETCWVELHYVEGDRLDRRANGSAYFAGTLARTERAGC